MIEEIKAKIKRGRHSGLGGGGAGAGAGGGREHRLAKAEGEVVTLVTWS